MLFGEIEPSAVLTVQATGSGKSAIPQTIATVRGGITVVVENTLALSSDQNSKIQGANTDIINLVTFQLDESIVLSQVIHY